MSAPPTAPSSPGRTSGVFGTGYHAQVSVEIAANVRMVIGDIVRYRPGDGPYVLVNPANRWLQHGGGVAAAYALRWPTDMEGFRESVKDSIPFPAVTLLPQIVHGDDSIERLLHVCYEPEAQAENPQRQLREVYRKTREFMRQMHSTEIILPLMGAGIFGYDEETSMKYLMNEAAQDRTIMWWLIILDETTFNRLRANPELVSAVTPQGPPQLYPFGAMSEAAMAASAPMLGAGAEGAELWKTRNGRYILVQVAAELPENQASKLYLHYFALVNANQSVRRAVFEGWRARAMTWAFPERGTQARWEAALDDWETQWKAMSPLQQIRLIRARSFDSVDLRYPMAWQRTLMVGTELNTDKSEESLLAKHETIMADMWQTAMIEAHEMRQCEEVVYYCTQEATRRDGMETTAQIDSTVRRACVEDLHTPIDIRLVTRDERTAQIVRGQLEVSGAERHMDSQLTASFQTARGASYIPESSWSQASMSGNRGVYTTDTGYPVDARQPVPASAPARADAWQGANTPASARADAASAPASAAVRPIVPASAPARARAQRQPNPPMRDHEGMAPSAPSAPTAERHGASDQALRAGLQRRRSNLEGTEERDETWSEAEDDDDEAFEAMTPEEMHNLTANLRQQLGCGMNQVPARGYPSGRYNSPQNGSHPPRRDQGYIPSTPAPRARPVALPLRSVDPPRREPYNLRPRRPLGPKPPRPPSYTKPKINLTINIPDFNPDTEGMDGLLQANQGMSGRAAPSGPTPRPDRQTPAPNGANPGAAGPQNPTAPWMPPPYSLHHTAVPLLLIKMDVLSFQVAHGMETVYTVIFVRVNRYIMK